MSDNATPHRVQTLRRLVERMHPTVWEGHEFIPKMTVLDIIDGMHLDAIPNSEAKISKQVQPGAAAPSGEGGGTRAGTGDSESQTRSGPPPDLTSHATRNRAATFEQRVRALYAELTDDSTYKLGWDECVQFAARVEEIIRD